MMNIFTKYRIYPTGIIGVIAFVLEILNMIPAQAMPVFSRDIKDLTTGQSSVRIAKREVIPGIVIFNRQNGCLLKGPVSRNFLENGKTIETSSRILISGNSIPQSQSEYKKPWQSKLTDYQAGEYKIMLLQIGYHPPVFIQVEESEQKLLDAQTLCSVATYQIIKNNLSLLKPITQPNQNNLSISVNNNWERYFSNDAIFQPSQNEILNQLP